VRVARAHARASIVELARHPSYAVPTLLFPTMFFLFFVAPRVEERDVDVVYYAGFAVLGIAFFQFGFAIAAERASPWEVYLRTLPARPAARFAARVACAGAFSVAAITVLVAAAAAVDADSVAGVRWHAVVPALVAGGAPFALLGIAIGYWSTPRGALPLANVLYLALSFGGGLWTGPDRLPAVVGDVSPFLPTRHFADVLGGAARGGLGPPAAWAWLALAGVAFGALAAAGYRRDEGQRFR
jgi:ABC-2 type transport system permease protein